MKALLKSYLRSWLGQGCGMEYLSGMERTCSHCHAELKVETAADWCPACGGALIDRESLPAHDQPSGPPPEVDHRGIVLPRRHALGGIITPQ
jgi:predicted RNA-binding Zn-ribbon protein involved in translation (DUF1610 family)